MNLKVLHLSHTPLVGAPGRICEALRTLGCDARWAVLKAENYGGLSFELDWRWEEHREEVLAFAAQADIIHLHNYVDLNCKDFAPLDFRALWASGRPMLRHFHSTPQLVARYMGIDEQSVLDCPLPKLVIAQYPERFFPHARIVPNIVSEVPDRADRSGLPLRIGYAPSNFRSARASRWDTKGYPETRKLLLQTLKTLKRAGREVELDLITQVPHRECIQRKAQCDVFIDDLVTGSYHLNTLESLIQGCATLTHLDGRIQRTLFDLLGRADFPALDVRLESLPETLDLFAADPALARSLGAQSRTWMHQFWTPALMGQHFLDAYSIVLRSPGTPFPSRFGTDAASSYRTRDHYDAAWAARHRTWPRLTPDWILSARHAMGQTLRKLGLRT